MEKSQAGLSYAGENLYRSHRGTYFAKFKVHGKGFKRSLKTPDKDLARRRLAALRQEMTHSSPAADQRKMNLATLSDHWLASKRGEVTPSTQERLAGLVVLFKRAFGSSIVRDLTVAQVEQWRIRRQQEIAPRTFNKELETLRAILDYGQGFYNLIAEHPCAKIKRIKRIDAHKPVIPTKAQFSALLEELRRSPQASRSGAPELCEFLGYSGCRIGEALGVTVESVNFEAGFLRIIPGKGHAERALPLFAPLDELLRRLIAHQPAGALFRFKGDNGMRQALLNACERAKLPRFTHHHLRHFFCSNAIEAGVDFKAISVWLGHKDGGVLVARTYGHLRDTHSAQMAKLLTYRAEPAAI